MPAENEVIPADGVAAAVVAAYREPATATLIRRGFNDTYEVLCPSGGGVAATAAPTPSRRAWRPHQRDSL